MMTLGLLSAACVDDIYRSTSLIKAEKIRINARYTSDPPAFSEANKAVVHGTSGLVLE